jgi:hypothetical protein
MNSTPPKVVYLVIVIMGVIAFIGVTSLCLTLFYKNYADPAVLTAIISITSGSIGSLGTMLVSTRSQPPATSMDTTISTTTKGQPSASAAPAPVVITNQPENPVPVTEKPTT